MVSNDHCLGSVSTINLSNVIKKRILSVRQLSRYKGLTRITPMKKSFDIVLLVTKRNRLVHFPNHVVCPVFAVRNVASFRDIHKTGLDTYISHINST